MKKILKHPVILSFVVVVIVALVAKTIRSHAQDSASVADQAKAEAAQKIAHEMQDDQEPHDRYENDEKALSDLGYRFGDDGLQKIDAPLASGETSARK